MLRHGTAVLLAAGALMALAGCAGGATQPVESPGTGAAPSTAVATPSTTEAPNPGATSTITFTATQVPSSSPTPSPSPAVSATPAATPAALPGLAGSIGFGRIGQLTTAMTIAQVKGALGSPVRIDDGNPQCLGQTFGGAAGDQGSADAELFALATTHGARGPVDVLALGPSFGGRPMPAAVLARLPRTAEGIGIGSAFADVLRAYPSAVVGSLPSGDGRQATITDGSGLAIAFTASPKGATIVSDVATGIARLTPPSDGCG